MCPEHASTIDEPTNVDAYPVELLRKLKADQHEEYERLKQGWMLDTEMAQEVIRKSFSDAEAVVIENSTLHLGGEGGKAPGAGGGGGGAIGRGARAGRGGPGGGHRIDCGEYTLPLAKEGESNLPEMKPQPERIDPEAQFYPGAGGGGAGAIGDGAIAGDGGGGGEHVSAHIDIAELTKAGFDHIEFTVGKGGRHGAHGEDTVVKFVTKDGTVLRTIRAQGGRSGSSYLPDGVVELSADDIKSGFRITTFMAANAAEFRDGLVFVLGGDWDDFPVPHVPFETTWSLLCTARWHTLAEPAARGLFLSLIHPAGHEVSRVNLIIPAEAMQHLSCRWIQTIGATLDTEGAWTVRLHSGGLVLAEIDIRVRLQHASS
jgi:hypothetical protein